MYISYTTIFQFLLDHTKIREFAIETMVV